MDVVSAPKGNRTVRHSLCNTEGPTCCKEHGGSVLLHGGHAALIPCSPDGGPRTELLDATNLPPPSEFNTFTLHFQYPKTPLLSSFLCCWCMVESKEKWQKEIKLKMLIGLSFTLCTISVCQIM
ncbi:uncharacterized protein DS421_11g337600 [Arachis hypogaea]|nr:uncharacterized protein DS421_11g337600 [Arachis hypogaea]